MTAKYFGISLIVISLLQIILLIRLFIIGSGFFDILLLIISTILSLGTVVQARCLFKPMRMVADQVSRLKDGDLTIAVDYVAGNELGEIATAINVNLKNLRELLSLFSAEAEKVSVKSVQIAASTDASNRAISSIARTVTELAKGAQQTGNMAQNAAVKTNEVSELAKNVVEKMQALLRSTQQIVVAAQQGSTAVKQSTAIVNEIAAMAQNNVNLGVELKEKSERVRVIVELINDVTAQTNLLALNAAIEAARAGEHGRGFALVAEEVRKLAERSRQAADQINKIVRSMLEDITNVVQAFESSREGMTSGVNSIAEASVSFSDITANIEKTRAESQEVALLADTQAQAAVDLISTVNGVAAIAEQSAAAAQSVADSAQQITSSISDIANDTQAMSGLAGNLEQAIFRFRFSNKKTLRVAINLSDQSTLYAGLREFAQQLSLLSERRYELKIFHSSQLGNELDLLQKLREGTLEMACVSSSTLTSFDKRIMVFDFPLVFNDESVAEKVLHSRFARKMLDMLEQYGFYGLTFAESGFRDMTNSRQAILRLEDFKDLRIRTMQNPLHMETWRALGTEPVAMPFAKVYEALEEKAVDGQENPISIIYSGKLYEVQKYLTLTHHVYTPFVELYSKQLWETIPLGDQLIVAEAARQGADYTAKANRHKQDEFLSEMRNKGMIINRIQPEEMARIQEAVKPVINNFTNEIGIDLVDEFFAATRSR